MDDVLFAQVLQGLKDLDCESADQAQGYAHEVVSFDEFVQVYTEKFEGEEEVRTEHAVIFYSNDVVLVVGVILTQV